ncbi:3-oxoacyl-[acyl-carrier-protein] synthase III [Tissierella praeacuta DSM 18095]|uniref:Beta-ketoacyl-[acyl-carrier-protein] synthase III n=1 Tax=Tissierella praeacuta DSM 18095 TaxID=1123404 RepID=A0A1M4W5C2_9FIRM|nr:beta-ketoacyl-ACP synthase III [Tissierella praeacuta]TCU75618.1 3-oxoacyl-[acyl-carrier-protein] synthase III [Tissierella praeacuta]SHE76293.1 3-oxoacyl-[acyl-carrier-protein] synthase III [Tissierella praeacuta DSM 18095]SUP00082.1 3-oxoacyl-[acyl-carrier-protein] synthase 3 [Tissierella praeacuta]
MKDIYVGISGVGSYVPEKVVTNNDLSKIVETSDEWIIERTGIHERRIASDNMATSDMATMAAKNALEDANIKSKDIDLIIVATVTSDHAFPSTACIIQKNIGAVNAAAFDINVGCSGFVYGLSIGESFIKSGMYKKVLVIGAETLSKIVDWGDRNTCVLFGDGAGACVLEKCEEGFGILSIELGSDGNNGEVLTQPAGGSRIPASIDTIENKLHFIKMDGKEVFKFAVRVMEKTSINTLKKANLELNDLDFLIPHQANMRIIDAAAKKLKLEKDKICVNLNKYGNMSSASIPVALNEAVKDNRIKKGDNILLVAFGAGLTWASMVIRWSRRDGNV